MSTIAPLTFSKEDLIYLATGGDTIQIRRSAAEALYAMGQRDGAREVSDVRNTLFETPLDVNGSRVTP